VQKKKKKNPKVLITLLYNKYTSELVQR